MKYSLDHVKSMHIGTAKDMEIVVCMNDLHPELKAILDLELDAGNFVRDASKDWPDKGSVFITLKEPFKRRHEAKDPVKYDEPNDPHYWKADYSCGTPVHVIAH